MRGYCPKCREYRSDSGENAWAFDWTDDLPICRKCGSVVEVWDDNDLSE